MKQLMWKEWRKTRTMFLLFCCLNLWGIFTTFDKSSDLVAYVVHTLNSIFLALLLPAVVFIGDDEQNSGEFTAALPISRNRAWGSRFFYIVLLSVVFHGLFFKYALDAKLFTVYFALTTVAMVMSSIFVNSFIIAFLSIVTFGCACVFLVCLSSSLFFFETLTMVLGIVAILLTVPFLIKTPLRYVNFLVALLFTVELFFVYHNYKMGQLHYPHHVMSSNVAENSVTGNLFFSGIGICALVISHRIFVHRKPWQKVFPLFITLGTTFICFALFFNPMYREVEYRHLDGNIFVSDSRHYPKGNLYDYKMMVFDRSTQTMGELDLYWLRSSYGNGYVLCWDIQFNWRLPARKNYYVYNCSTMQRYDIPIDFANYEDVFYKNKRLLLISKDKLAIFKLEDKLQHQFSYEIDKDSRFQGMDANYAYFFRKLDGELTKMNLHKKEKQNDRSIFEQMLGDKDSVSIVDSYIEDNRFFIVEKAHGFQRELWIKDLQNNTLQKVFTYTENEIFNVWRLQISTVTNECIVRYRDHNADLRTTVVNMKNGITTQFKGRFLHINHQQFLLITETSIRLLDFATKKVLYEKPCDYAPQRGLLLRYEKLYFRSNDGLHYLFDIQKQKLHKVKIPSECYIMFADEGGIFYEDEERKIHYKENSFAVED